MSEIGVEMSNTKNIGQLFTSQAINAVADGDFSLLHELIGNVLTPKFFPVKVSEIFDIAFKKLSREYKSEYFFKNIIFLKYRIPLPVCTISFILICDQLIHVL